MAHTAPHVGVVAQDLVDIIIQIFLALLPFLRGRHQGPGAFDPSIDAGLLGRRSRRAIEQIVEGQAIEVEIGVAERLAMAGIERHEIGAVDRVQRAPPAIRTGGVEKGQGQHDEVTGRYDPRLRIIDPGVAFRGREGSEP